MFVPEQLIWHQSRLTTGEFVRGALTFAGVALALTAVSGLAAYLLARRAASIDPVQALREEG